MNNIKQQTTFSLPLYTDTLNYQLASLVFVESEVEQRAVTIHTLSLALTITKEMENKTFFFNYTNLPIHMRSRAKTIINLMQNALSQVENNQTNPFFELTQKILVSEYTYSQFNEVDLYTDRRNFEDDAIDKFRDLYTESHLEFPEDDIKELHTVIPLDTLNSVQQIEWVIENKKVFFQLFQKNKLPRYAFILYFNHIYNYCEKNFPKSIFKYLCSVQILDKFFNKVNNKQNRSDHTALWVQNNIISNNQKAPPANQGKTEPEKCIVWNKNVIDELQRVGINEDFLQKQHLGRQHIFNEHGFAFVSFIDNGVPAEEIINRSDYALEFFGKNASNVFKHLLQVKDSTLSTFMNRGL